MKFSTVFVAFGALLATVAAVPSPNPGGYSMPPATGYGGYKGSHDAYALPHFEYPPPCERVKEHMHKCGHELKEWFEKCKGEIHGFFHAIKGALKGLLAKIKHKFNCFAAHVHIRFRKCKSDWERVEFWGKCKLHHLKHWIAYEKELAAGKKEIYTRFVHDLICTLREYKAQKKAEYEEREKKCHSETKTYGEVDVQYYETVGYAGYEAPYGKGYKG